MDSISAFGSAKQRALLTKAKDFLEKTVVGQKDGSIRNMDGRPITMPQDCISHFECRQGVPLNSLEMFAKFGVAWRQMQMTSFQIARARKIGDLVIKQLNIVNSASIRGIIASKVFHVAGCGEMAHLVHSELGGTIVGLYTKSSPFDPAHVFNILGITKSECSQVCEKALQIHGKSSLASFFVTLNKGILVDRTFRIACPISDFQSEATELLRFEKEYECIMVYPYDVADNRLNIAIEERRAIPLALSLSHTVDYDFEDVVNMSFLNSAFLIEKAVYFLETFFLDSQWKISREKDERYCLIGRNHSKETSFVGNSLTSPLLDTLKIKVDRDSAIFYTRSCLSIIILPFFGPKVTTLIADLVDPDDHLPPKESLEKRIKEHGSSVIIRG